jgi:hypothetical protein
MMFSGDSSTSYEDQTPRKCQKNRNSHSPSHDTKQRTSSSEQSSDEKDKVMRFSVVLIDAYKTSFVRWTGRTGNEQK